MYQRKIVCLNVKIQLYFLLACEFQVCKLFIVYTQVVKQTIKLSCVSLRRSLKDFSPGERRTTKAIRDTLGYEISNKLFNVSISNAQTGKPQGFGTLPHLNCDRLNLNPYGIHWDNLCGFICQEPILIVHLILLLVISGLLFILGLIFFHLICWLYSNGVFVCLRHHE